ncbi:MAG: mechanosensitive ion channel [Proteobacteria bacterium]|nr:mechanosensitive ion channel [Pseudomonadota bacterium]HQR03686.1 mechanosensitive ion channel [Rhodocyclaceae bacterium]
MNSDLDNMALALWEDFQHPDVGWQAVALVACIVVGKLVERLVRGYGGVVPAPWREGGLRRMTFPLTTTVLVFVARYVLRGSHPVNLLSIAIPLLLSLAGIRAVFFALRQVFAQTRWLASFERIFSLLTWTVVAMHILGLLPGVIDFLESVNFTVGRQNLSLWLLLQGLATVVVALLTAFWCGGVVERRLLRAEDMDGNLRVVFTRLAKALLVLVAILVSLPLVGIDLTTLSVFGGALGVGLGFGLQKIASNYVSGFIILLDRSIRLGNMIEVDSNRGQVTRITTRYTVLRGSGGVESLVPNEVLVSSVVLNESYTDRRVRVALPVQVAYGTDLDQALVLLEAAARNQPRVLSEPSPAALVVSFADSGINLEVGFWIHDPETGTGRLKSEINLAIWRTFKAAGIQMPFPQREVRILSGTP